MPDLCRFQDGRSPRTVRAGSDDVRIDASVHDPVNQRVTSSILRLASEGISVRAVFLRYAWPPEAMFSSPRGAPRRCGPTDRCATSGSRVHELRDVDRPLRLFAVKTR